MTFSRLPVALGSVDEEVVDGNALLVVDECFVVVEVEIFVVVGVVCFVVVVEVVRWDVVVGVV